MRYSKKEYEQWKPLDEHLKNPIGFPGNKASNFFVVFSPPSGYEDKYPWKDGEPVLFLGEIAGMHGHAAFVGEDGRIRCCYHTDNFYVIPEEEL